MFEQAIEDAIYYLQEALRGGEQNRLEELENARLAIRDAIVGVE